MQNKRQTSGWVLILLGAMSASIGKAVALQVSPPRIEFFLNPSQSASSSFTVTNDLPEPVRVHVSSKDWFVLPANKGITVGDWMTLGQKQFDLDVGESRDVSFSVRAPSVPAPAQGSLVGMASFLQETQNGTGVSTIISASVYITLKGTEKKDFAVKNLGLRVKDGQFQAGVVVENKGNLHLRPQGRIELRDKRGAVVASVQFQEGRPVYPGQERNYVGAAPWPSPRPGIYKAVLLLQLWDIPEEIVYKARVTRKGLEILGGGKKP
jgi:hypothetical protein